jgi:hypothetical protein
LALWLVVLGRVELQFSEEFAVVGEDADVSIVDQNEDVGAGVASADADVVEPAVVSQGEDAAGVDLVVADAEPVNLGETGHAGNC